MRTIKSFDDKSESFKWRTINGLINRLRTITACANKMLSRSQYTAIPSDDQLWNFAISMTSGKWIDSYSNKSAYELLAELMLDDISHIVEFRKMITQMTERDINKVDNPFIKHDLYKIEEHRYFFHIRPKPLNFSIVDDGVGRLVIQKSSAPPSQEAALRESMLESLPSIVCVLCVKLMRRAQRTWQWPAELFGLRSRRPSDAMVYLYAMNLVSKNSRHSSSIWSANAVSVATKLLDDSSHIGEFRKIVEGIGIYDRMVLGRKLAK